MDVAKRLAADAQVLAEQVAAIDTEALLASIMAQIDRLDAPHPTSDNPGSPVGHDGDRTPNHPTRLYRAG